MPLSQHTWGRHLGICLLVSGLAARARDYLRLPFVPAHPAGCATQAHSAGQAEIQLLNAPKKINRHNMYQELTLRQAPFSAGLGIIRGFRLRTYRNNTGMHC